MPAAKIRRYGFWLLDKLRGNAIGKHYEHIRNMMNNNPESAQVKAAALESLLKHACASSPFYASYVDKPLTSFPIVDKNIIRDNYDAILSSRYDKEKLHAMSTSGSTGTPFTVLQNADKRNRVLAELIYFGEQCGYYVGDRNVFFRTWTKENKKNPIKLFMQNQVTWDNSVLDESNLEQMRQELKNDQKIRTILGYASSLGILARYLLDRGESPASFSVDTIISGAEALGEDVRNNLKQVFDCHIVSRYSNQENGLLAQEFEDNVFVINSASYHIEFLKLNSNEPALSGEISRIVITDLFNYALPMIRYDIGDTAVFKEHPKYGRVIVSINGRKRDFLFDTQGRLVPPSAITVHMWKYDKLKQFQFIQKDKNTYVLNLNGAKGVYRDEEFVFLIKEIMGASADIKIRHVDGIPFLSSGKFQQVVCKFEK